MRVGFVVRSGVYVKGDSIMLMKEYPCIDKDKNEESKNEVGDEGETDEKEIAVH